MGATALRMMVVCDGVGCTSFLLSSWGKLAWGGQEQGTVFTSTPLAFKPLWLQPEPHTLVPLREPLLCVISQARMELGGGWDVVMTLGNREHGNRLVLQEHIVCIEGSTSWLLRPLGSQVMCWVWFCSYWVGVSICLPAWPLDSGPTQRSLGG